MRERASAHRFRVRATDGAGYTDSSPASHYWTVDTTEASIVDCEQWFQVGVLVAQDECSSDTRNGEEAFVSLQERL